MTISPHTFRRFTKKYIASFVMINFLKIIETTSGPVSYDKNGDTTSDQNIQAECMFMMSVNRDGSTKLSFQNILLFLNPQFSDVTLLCVANV